MIKIRIITEIGPFKSLIFKQVFIHQFEWFPKKKYWIELTPSSSTIE